MAVGDNTALGPMNTNWFVPAFNQGDLHLSGTHPVEIETAATWLAGDPATDIDGDARPTMDGAADFAGADLQ